MKKLLLYPYDKETTSIVRYRDLIDEYELSSIAAPKGWGSEGKDASYIDGGQALDFTIAESFEEAIENCESVLFLQGNTEGLLEVYKSKIQLAHTKGKEIIIEKRLIEQLELKDLLSYVHVLESKGADYESLKQTETIYNFDTPIALIFSDGEYCNKFDIQLGLRKALKKQGYKVSQIGTKSFSPLFGFEGMPDFMYDSQIGLKDKVIAFNHYVHEIESKEQPDLIIIGIPGGMMRINNKFTNHFGELAYVVGNAVQADIGIMSVYSFEFTNNTYLEAMRENAKHLLRCYTDYFHFANTRYVINSGGEEKLLYFTLDSQKDVLPIINKNKAVIKDSLILFNSHIENAAEGIYEKIVEELEENVAYI